MIDMSVPLMEIPITPSRADTATSISSVLPIRSLGEPREIFDVSMEAFFFLEVVLNFLLVYLCFYFSYYGEQSVYKSRTTFSKSSIDVSRSAVSLRSS